MTDPLSAALDILEDVTEDQVQKSATAPKPVVAQAATVAQTEDNGFKEEIVKDSKGNVLFKRIIPTIPHERPTSVLTRPANIKPEVVQEREVSANPAMLSFPTDRWGLTKDLKIAMTRMASRIAGDKAKLELAKEVLDILVEHLDLKYVSDRKYKERVARKD